MAVSKMTKIAVLFPYKYLDSIIELLQSTKYVQIQDLKKQSNWEEAFASKKISTPRIKISKDLKSADYLIDDDAIQYLANQENQFEQLIEQLKKYLPTLGTIKKLRTPPKTMTFNELMVFGKSGKANQLQESITDKITRLKQINQELLKDDSVLKNLAKWEKLDFLPKDLGKFQHFHAQIGTISKTDDNRKMNLLNQNPEIKYQIIFESSKEYGVICFYQKNQKDFLEKIDFSKFDYQDEILPKDKIQKIKTKDEQLKTEKQAIISKLEKYNIELQMFCKQIDFLLAKQTREQAKKSMVSTPHLAGLEGWIESDNLSRLKAIIASKYKYSVEVIEVKDNSSQEEIPVKLRNRSLIKPFELVTEMYALPKYNEKDPTPYLAPFYFTFFGMMVADLGYGLLLFLLTLFAQKLFYLPKKTARFFKFFNILAISVCIWGLIYGSFFGYELPFHVLSTSTDVMSILILSVIFGFITVISGLFLGGLQKIREKNYADAYNSGFAWCLILIGLFLLAIGSIFKQYAILTEIGKWLAISNGIAIIIVSVIQSKSIAGLGKGLFNLYDISSYVGDLVSFTRLMALGLSGASIGSAFNLIVGLFPGISKFTIGVVIFVLLHAINLFLSLLSGYVHGARLIFVEFFGKFYEGGGQPFTPLKPTEKYINIKNQTEDK